MKTQELYDKVLDWFRQNRPLAQSELQFGNAYELLVAVILSAQCTDKRVNMTTPALFARFPDPLSMSRSDEKEIYSYIKSISYPNNKAAHLLGMAKKLVEDFGGKVPSEVEDLMKLPGVGRKTANVVASVFYNQPKMAVDTHVFRVSERIGLTRNSKTPLETEKQLMRHIPVEDVAQAHHWLILHGRYVCVARKPRCEECGLTAWCRYYAATRKGETDAAKKRTAAGKKKAPAQKTKK